MPLGGGHPNAPPQMAPPQQLGAPPMAPPKGGSGPKAMAAALAPPQRGPSSSSGVPGQSETNVHELSQGLAGLHGLYQQLETNQKLRGETEQKFSVLMERMSSGCLQETTLQRMQALVQAVEADNSQAASAAFRELTVKCWNDVKDFSPALKALSTFKQRFPQYQQ
jgi:hypothetical protein